MKALLLLFLAVQDPSVDELIDKLGSESIVERDEAAVRLLEIGRKAIPDLRNAAKDHGDAEVRVRAENIIRQLTSLPWITDIDGALKTAAAKKKPLLVFSTGGPLNGYT